MIVECTTTPPSSLAVDLNPPCFLEVIGKIQLLSMQERASSSNMQRTLFGRVSLEILNEKMKKVLFSFLSSPSDFHISPLTRTSHHTTSYHTSHYCTCLNLYVLHCTESPLGGTLLSLIGGVYLDRARAEANTFMSIGLAIKHSGNLHVIHLLDRLIRYEMI